MAERIWSLKLPMPQNTTLRIRDKLYVYSFTTGIAPAKLPDRKSDNEVMAELMWLVQHGKADEAELLLEKHCKSR